MAKVQPVTTFQSEVSSIAEAIGVMVRCNYSKNVDKYIQTGKKYIIDMPNIKTILYVTCTFAAIRAADMHIDMALVNGERDYDSETCTISYNYESFDSIYYTSFRSRDPCIVYVCIKHDP